MAFGGAKSCKRGSVYRRGFSYKRASSGKRVRVKGHCVPSKGLRSRGQRPRAFIPPLKSGELSRFGYSSKKSASARHRSLTKAAKSYGTLNMSRKLHALSTLTRNTAPRRSRVFKADARWLSKKRKRSSRRH